MSEHEQHPPPEVDDISRALEALIGPGFAPPQDASDKSITDAKPLLTLECVGGRPLPPHPELPERVVAVRDLLARLVTRFAEPEHLPRSRLERKFPHLSSRAGESEENPFDQEAVRLVDAANVIFQLHDPMPIPKRGKLELWREAREIWKFEEEEKGENPSSMWFKRLRLGFVCEVLAEWIVDCEKAYREADSPPPPDNDAGSPALITETTSSPADAVLDEPAPSKLTGAGDNGAEGDNSDGEDLNDLDAEATVPPPSPVTPRHQWIGWLVILALVAALTVAALVLDGGETSANAAGEVNRVIDAPAPEDMAVAGDFVWLVNANDQTAIRVSAESGERETIFVDQPPFVSEPLPGTRTSVQTGGYQVAAGPDRAWIVTNGGVMLTIGTTGRKVEILNFHIRILAGEPVLYRGSLWVGGLGEYPLHRLRAHDGAIQREYKLRAGPVAIDKLAAGVGSIWAYTDEGGDDPKVYKLTPVPGRLGVEEGLLRLDHPAFDLAAGLGGVWTVNSDRTVTWHDPATGGSARTIQVPGGAQQIALGQEAVWVTTDDNAVVRIDPISLDLVGEPIPLPGAAYEIDADKSAWVATAKKLVEIES
jgi:hypothetical protein